MQEDPTQPARIGMPGDAITAIPVTLPTGAMMLDEALNVYGTHLLRDAGTSVREELDDFGSLSDLPTDAEGDAVREAAIIGRIRGRIYSDTDPLNHDDTSVPLNTGEEIRLVEEALDYAVDATKYNEFSLDQFRDWLPDDDGTIAGLERLTA